VLIALSTLAVAGAAFTASEAAPPPVDPGALAHCASMTVADERLACYDSLSRPKSNPAPVAPAAAASGASTAPAPSTATRAGAKAAAAPAAASTVAAPAAAAATAGSAAATGAAPAADSNSFGLTRHPPPAEEGPQRIQAKVTRVDTDRLGNVHVSLDNGQAWIFNAPEALLRVGEPVTIKRGTIGSFLLTTASHHTYRVQRTQ
jgi:hypothetical protein